LFYFSDCEERWKIESCIYSFVEEMTRVWSKRQKRRKGNCLNVVTLLVSDFIKSIGNLPDAPSTIRFEAEPLECFDAVVTDGLNDQCPDWLTHSLTQSLACWPTLSLFLIWETIISYPYKTTITMILLCISVFMFLGIRLEGDRCWTKWYRVLYCTYLVCCLSLLPFGCYLLVVFPSI